MNENLEILKEKILAIMSEEGVLQTEIEGLKLAKHYKTTHFQKMLYEPSCILMLQGKKQLYFGSKSVSYSQGEYLISCSNFPVNCSIIEASSEKPCAILALELDSIVIAKLITEMNFPKSLSKESDFLASEKCDDSIISSFIKLVDLLDKPKEEQKILAPIIKNEIYCRLLLGSLGNQIRLINTKGTLSNNVAEAISYIKANFKEKMNIDDLAKEFNMASSSFYRNFKKITKITPLQYQKQLKLYEAKKLMLSGDYDAETASFEVGYESSTQFSREYKNFFGNPPLRDIKQLAAV